MRLRIIAGAALCIAGACARQRSTPHHDNESGAATEPDVDSLIAEVRSATAPYRVLDSAVAAGYARNVTECVEQQPEGAMGYHHVNRTLLDDYLQLARPEMLVYGRDANGAYKLNGVEYIVPYTVRPPDAEPPILMGQRLKRADGLRLWYLHVWVWEPNPKGVFADWNPSVRC